MIDELIAQEDAYADGSTSNAPIVYGGAPKVASSVRQLPKRSSIVHEVSNFDTQDHEDHTFSGIQFNVKCGDKVPLVYTRIDSVWIRGMMGQMKVFIPVVMSKYDEIYDDPNKWRCIYNKFHEPSKTEYTELKLDEPLVLYPGEECGVYIHSAHESDAAIVYDESSYDRQIVNNGMVAVMPHAMAHLYHEPFNEEGWRGWRRHREFVGKISFGVKWMLWSPEQHQTFPTQFKEIVQLMLLIWNRMDSVVSWLPQEMVFYILNMMKWDCFGKPAVQQIATVDSDSEDESDNMRRRMAHHLGLGRHFDGHFPPQLMEAFRFMHAMQMFQNDGPDEGPDDDDDDTDDNDDNDDNDDEDRMVLDGDDDSSDAFDFIGPRRPRLSDFDDDDDDEDTDVQGSDDEAVENAYKENARNLLNGGESK